MNKQIPALSLRQPWAWAIFSAGKTIENRTWGTSYRGRIRIHAAQTWDEDGESWLTHRGLIVPNRFVCRDQGTLGAYMGEVTVVQCRAIDAYYRERHQPWAFGPVCWELENPIAYREPIPGRGYPGLYYETRFEK